MAKLIMQVAIINFKLNYLHFQLNVGWFNCSAHAKLIMFTMINKLILAYIVDKDHFHF